MITDDQRAALLAYMAGLSAMLADGATMPPKRYRRLMHEWRRVRDFIQAADLALKANRRRPC